MSLIKEWNQATGHVEILATVPDHIAAAWISLSLVGDHGTDHVVYAEHVDKEDQP